MLRAFEMLKQPLYIYSFETQRVVWSNPGAQMFWNAADSDELRKRELTPYSASTSTRLEAYREAFSRGETRHESWTYYPKGEATSALANCSGVSIAGHDQAMLVEIEALTPVELPESELRAIEALRHTPLMISLFSETGRLLMHNPAALACFGTVAEHDCRSDNCLLAMFADPADCDRLMDEARAQGVAMRTATMSAPGAPVHAVQLQFVSDPATGEPAILIAQQDVSPLVRISRQLAASEEALDAILSLDVAPALVISAQAGVVLKANVAAETLLGPDLADKAHADHVFADPSEFDALLGTVLTAGVTSMQLQVRTATRGTIWVSVSGARIVYDRQDSIVILITDINQLYQTAADLGLALDLERRTTASQKRVLAIASHDFRTPLSVIDWAAQKLVRSAETLSPDDIRSRGQRIRSTVQKMLRLVENTLERARSNQSAMGYAPEFGNVATVIEAVVRTLGEGNPALKVNLSLANLPEINLDGALMEQAVINLLSNAIKYSEDSPRIDISATAGPDSLVILFRDWGVGIPVGERDRVFSDYVRGSNVGAIEGTGLGLSIVSQIINLHGGLVEVVETVGPGTTIKVTLPRP